jgi:hypothetical protein
MKECRDIVVVNCALHSGIPYLKNIYPINVKHTSRKTL